VAARDGFADFFGYAEAAPGGAPAVACRSRDGFADFFGYPEDDSTVPPELHTVFLPDRDPVSPRSGGVGEGLAHPDRQWVDATEASLALVRLQIESKRLLLRRLGGEDAEAVREDLLLLKLQQARLAEALWQDDGGGQAARGGEVRPKRFAPLEVTTGPS